MDNNFTVTKPYSLYLAQVGKLADIATRYAKNGKHSPAVRVAIEFLYEQPDDVIAAAFDRFGNEEPEAAQ